MKSVSLRSAIVCAGALSLCVVASAASKVMRFEERCLSKDAVVVAKGVSLDRLEVLEAEMGGSWVPGGPYPCRVERVSREAEKGTLTCQLQSLSPQDGVMRVVGLELAQADADVTARLLWARYRYGSDAGTYGADFDDEKVRHGQCGIAADYAAPGYGIGCLVLGQDGARLVDAQKVPASAKRASAPEELLADVHAVDVGGGAIPGPFAILATNAFPLAEARVGSGATAFVSVGTTFGRGRAVSFGHPGFFQGANCLLDGRRLVGNALAWTARGKAKPRVAVLREAGVAGFFRELGCADVRVVADVPARDTADVLVATGFRAADVDAAVAFVEAGGGLLNTSLGWGYLYFNREAKFARDFADNQVMARLGYVQGPTMAGRVNKAFPVAKGDDLLGARGNEALKLPLSKVWTRLGIPARRQVSATLGILVSSLPPDACPDCETKLAALASVRKAAKVPGVRTPVTEADALARLAILFRQNAWQTNPEKPVAADPAAAVYPGLVAPGTPTVSREVTVNLAVPRWQSTGVFASAGGPLTVMLPAGAEKLGLKVRIGSTADDLTGKAEWKRAPRVTVEHPLTKRETTVHSPFGGLVYIVVPESTSSATEPLRLTLAGGVKAPWFKLGRDKPEDFAAECAASGAPYGEIEGTNFVMTAETVGLRRVKDPAWIARYWDKVIAADRDLAQLQRRYPERMCSDVQLTSGWMHNGYPLMTHQNEAHLDWAIDEERLAKGEGWGCYHEAGHNHQDRVWTPACCGEVTVNLFTVLAIEKVAGQDWREERFESGRGRMARRVASWKSRGATYEDWKKDPFLQLELYLRLQEAFGWDAYRETIGRYWKPGFRRPNTADDIDIFNVFVRTMSDVTKTNLADVFAAWSVPMSDATRVHCAAYPAAPASCRP